MLKLVLVLMLQLFPLPGPEGSAVDTCNYGCDKDPSAILELPPEQLERLIRDGVIDASTIFNKCE